MWAELTNLLGQVRKQLRIAIDQELAGAAA